MTGCIDGMKFITIKQFDAAKLFVGNAQNANLSIIRKKGSDPLHMDIGVLTTRTVTHVNGELKHRESISLQILTKINVCLLVLFRFSRQIE